MTRNRKLMVAALILMGLCCVSIAVVLIVNNQKLNTQTKTPTPLVIVTSAPAAELFDQNQTGVSNSGKRNIPLQSVVLITALYYENGSLEVGWTGSGSIVSKDGLILTNAHVVLSDEDFKVDVLTIAPTKSADEKPMPAYIAKVIQADAQMDLAIIKVISDLNGNPVDTSALNFPVVTLGDSNKLSLGDKLTILGYPGIGGDTITLTSGEVAGFTSEAGYGSRAFIKTSATIAGGNSGGLAADEAGRLVGIPTQLGSGGDSNIVDCRYLADTNNDGFIDANDTCIPTGGFINSLRPVNLAIPMIEAARRGEERIMAVPATRQVESPQTDGQSYSDDFSSSNSGWTNMTDSDGLVGYSNGSYVISVSSSNMVLSGTSGVTADDVIMNVSTKIVQSTGQGDFGLICRQQSDGSYYAFEIREDGYVSIWKNYSNNIVPLVDWVYYPTIKGRSEFNLTASCVGSQLSLAVDGQNVLSTSDTDYSMGDTGLLGGTMNRGGFIVTFDNFSMHTP
jgi:S1-C subfamily serine protease